MTAWKSEPADKFADSADSDTAAPIKEFADQMLVLRRRRAAESRGLFSKLSYKVSSWAFMSRPNRFHSYSGDLVFKRELETDTLNPAADN